MTDRAGYRQTLPLLATLLLAFLLPAPFLFGSVGVIAVVVATVFLRGKTVFRNLATRRLLWAPIFLYLWTLASWFWSADKAEAGAILSTKLPLLLLPLTLGNSGLFRQENLRRVLFAFSAGLAVAALYCIWNAWNRYQVTPEFNTFFYHRLIAGLDANAVYMAWYVVMALLFLLLEPLASSGRLKWEVGIRGILLAVLLPFFLLLSARTLLVTFLLLALPVALFRSSGKKMIRPQKVLIWLFAASIGVAMVLAARQPAMQERFRELGHSKPELSYLDHYQGEEYLFTNMNVRLFLWRVGYRSLVSSPQLFLAGAGVGDAHEAINKEVRLLGFTDVEKDSPKRSSYYNINLHNTYLHTAVGTGLPGLLLAAFMVGSLIFVGVRLASQIPYLLLFAVISALFMMQEGVFETQAGTVFYSFMFSLFMDYFYTQKKENITPVGVGKEPL